MTKTPGQATRVGGLYADGEGGDVFEENGVFYSVGSTLVIDENDQEIIQPTRSDDFPTLTAFIGNLPSGVRFVATGAEGDDGIAT